MFNCHHLQEGSLTIRYYSTAALEQNNPLKHVMLDIIYCLLLVC